MHVSEYRTANGAKTVIVCEPGRKWLPVIFMDCPVRVVKVELTEQRYMTAIDYPIKRARRKFLKAGRILGITKGAKRLLRKGVKS